jgi:hypothetical protein
MTFISRTIVTGWAKMHVPTYGLQYKPLFLYAVDTIFKEYYSAVVHMLN